MSNVVIRVESVSKRYRLGQIGGGSLREDLHRWWARVRGERDPYLAVDDATPDGDLESHHWALRDVSFDIRQGEIVGVIGRNGAGKSTLLKLLSRITAPTSGTLKIRGRVGSLLEVGTGFHPELSGRENIYLNGAILGMRKQEIDAHLEEIVEFSELATFIDTPVKRYSSGMYVRLAFAVAAHLKSEILIVDEVLAVGDTAFQEKCLGKMGDVAHSGRTVLFVSHQMSSIRQLCSRCLMLAGGGVHGDGSTGDMIEKYARASIDALLQATPSMTKPPLPHQKARVRSASLIDSGGNVVDWIENNTRGFIEIEFEVLQKAIACNVAFELFSMAHGIVLTTGLWDANYDALSMKRWPTGIYRYRVEMPLIYMRGGTYMLKVVALKPNYEIFDVMERALTFTIADALTPPAIVAEGRRGAINPLLEWMESPDSGEPGHVVILAEVATIEGEFKVRANRD